MRKETGAEKSTARARRALFASGAFYALVAFEFFYMASPFGVYLYAVYGPGLDWLEASGSTSWLIQFFLPHLVEETSSVLVDVHEPVGAVLFAGGLAGFAIGVFQIYRAKMRRSGAVTGGLYRSIRHPQYLALIVASIGMVLLWPRYLVVVATVTVTFIYTALAMAEERACLREFPGYADYMRRTGRFLPAAFRLGLDLRIPSAERRLARLAAWSSLYLAVTALALVAAFAIRVHAVDSLHTHTTGDGVYVSVVRLSDDDLAAVAEIARAAPEAQAALSGSEHLIAYVVPVNMYISEIPMVLPPGETFGHTVPRARDPNRYKVILTEAVFGGEGPREGGDILWHAVHKLPLAEVHVDLATGTVSATYPPPAKPFYGTRQVPLF